MGSLIERSFSFLSSQLKHTFLLLPEFYSLFIGNSMAKTSSLAPLALSFLFLFALCRSEEPQIVTVDVHAAKDLLRSGHRSLDVRTEEEFKKGHVDVENCFNIPYMFFTPEGRVKNPKFVEQVSSICGKDEHLVVGCQSGVRSVYATTDLLNAGFKNACNMGGGYIAWKENKFSVNEPKEEL